MPSPSPLPGQGEGLRTHPQQRERGQGAAGERIGEITRERKPEVLRERAPSGPGRQRIEFGARLGVYRSRAAQISALDVQQSYRRLNQSLQQ